MHSLLREDKPDSAVIWKSWGVPWESPDYLGWSLRDYDDTSPLICDIDSNMQPQLARFPKLMIPELGLVSGVGMATDEYTILAQYREHFDICFYAKHAEQSGCNVMDSTQ